ncbi:hypothetical protein N7495_009013 [Penicillium taxi]|uniref:uncharacterized protein n=1 Tax=Penicillium taxi TaxID=168475 RepID=UPI002544E8A3|nr:uncharacterized protein N7495_009013 [Penicillium taxi]KAJ5888972.1 hypothetical protein N7495_009013 [Penicillium taxi]
MASQIASPRLPILTQHCNFCNHLLLATTRNLSTLPRRAGEAQDKALILPLENNTQPDVDLEAESEQDRRATVIDRQDGIEKRVLLRCGRCRVVVGYYLDKVHWEKDKMKEVEEGGGEGDDADQERPPAVYILPGALIETGDLGEGVGVGEVEWRSWNGSS